MAAQEWHYPATRAEENENSHAGVATRDPYRWLEAVTSREVVGWSHAQDSLTRAIIGRAMPASDRILKRLSELASMTDHSVPLLAADRAFFLRLDAGMEKPVLMVESQGEAPRVVVDPRRLPAANEASVVSFAPSPDGRQVAYVLDLGGDYRELRVMDVDAGQDLGVRVSNARISRRPWSSDSRTLFYSLPSGAGNGGSGEKWEIRAIAVGDGTDTLVFERPDLSGWRLEVRVGDEGRLLVVTAQGGAGAASRLFVQELNGDASSRELLADASAPHSFVGNVGDSLLIQTDFAAPNGQVVIVDAAAPETRPWSVVPSGDAVLQETLRVGDRLLLYYLEGGRPVAVISDCLGEMLHKVELPIGLIWTDYLVSWSGFSGGPDQDVAFFRFLGLSAPRTIFQIDMVSGVLSVWKGSGTASPKDRYVTRRVEYRSADGVRIPMYVTHREDFVADGRTPVLLYGYGAFGWTALPFFNPKYRLFLGLGGVHAMPALRGGGSYGATWHEAGSRRNKQRTIDDLIAAAEWLIQEGYTSPSRLVIEGNSAGGVAVAGAITQRPELFSVSVIEVPLADMARLSTHSSWLTAEFGDPADPKDSRAMLDYSPYHHVHAGTDYPATLVTTGDEDRIAPSWHAYKLTAALQKAQASSRPILLRVDWGAGHGGNKSRGQRIAEWTDELAFVMWQLGIDVP